MQADQAWEEAWNLMTTANADPNPPVLIPPQLDPTLFPLAFQQYFITASMNTVWMSPELLK